jgi:hypothetical protein
MFFGKKERDLVKQVNDELAERVIGQPIAYYPISIEESNFNDVYGEAIDKVSLPPVRVYAYVVVENEQTNDRYGYEYQTKLTVNFSQKRLTADQNLYVRVGDFVQYGDQFYEIVKTYNDTRYYFGQVEHKFQISAECVRARQGTFRVLQALDRKPERGVVAGESTTPAPRVAPIPPINATYLTVTPNSRLSNERVLTAGSGITLTDTGANGTLTVASIAAAANGPSGSLQFTPGAGTFSGSHSLRFEPTTKLLELTGAMSLLGELTASTFRLDARSGSLAGSGSYLGLDSNNNVVIARASATAGSTPGGPTTSIQFNNAATLTGSANLTYDGSTVMVKGASHLSGGLVHKRTSVSANYSIVLTDYYLGVDTTASPVQLTIPAASTAVEGQTFVIKDEGGAAASNAITVSRSAADTIDGLTSTTIVSPYGALSLYTDGANWYIY